ncbi:MAG: Nitroimidazol reductase NimA, pyridoxamine 5'-phosphate oxidase superfamily [Chloroflexi bacterium]|nr:MAG: Nitroimidazol reductase NimA, pyridoxamine 5'-phosphate oxidase superfamily [Chloroflexota bacterium]
MPPLTAEERDDLLRTAGVLMRIATVDADGDPHVTPIWFIYEEDRLWFTPRAGSDWLRHLRAHPRFACVIDETAQPYRKLVIEGEAEIVHEVGEDEVWRDRYRRIAERYVEPAGALAYIRNTIDQPRALCALTLAEARVRSWRMPVADEPRSGIWHRRYYGAETTFGAEAGLGGDS